MNSPGVSMSSDSSYSLGSGSTPTLGSWVSRWERRKVEKKLHIYYQDDYMPNYSDVYQRLNMPDLDEEQRVYCEKVNHHLSSLNTSLRDLKYNPQNCMVLFEQLYQDLVTNETEEIIKRSVSEFLKELISLTNNIKDRKACEGGYTRLFDRLAFMCCLHTRLSLSKEDQVVWPKLAGTKNVISKPDMRLFKHGFSTSIESIQEEMLVSVVGVKKDSGHDPDDIDSQIQSLESSHLSSSCTSLADSEREEYEKIPIIELDLDKKVLGQHAGDLLLDLYHYFGKNEGSVMKMPGIIIHETDVFFTLLEISPHHFRKLERNIELDQEDKGIIFYSKPLNILVEKERRILIEMLIRLNNLKPEF